MFDGCVENESTPCEQDVPFCFPFLHTSHCDTTGTFKESLAFESTSRGVPRLTLGRQLRKCRKTIRWEIWEQGGADKGTLSGWCRLIRCRLVLSLPDGRSHRPGSYHRPSRSKLFQVTSVLKEAPQVPISHNRD